MLRSRTAGKHAESGWSPSFGDAAAGVLRWLHQWQDLINAGDIATAKPLFADDVTAFGSLTDMMEGRDDLIRRQWSQMWPRLKDFTFDYERLRIFGGAGDPFVTIVAPWSSLGRKGSDGWYERRGRSSLVLRREADGYVCVHSHFSMEPGIPPIID